MDKRRNNNLTAPSKPKERWLMGGVSVGTVTGKAAAQQ